MHELIADFLSFTDIFYETFHVEKEFISEKLNKFLYVNCPKIAKVTLIFFHHFLKFL